MILKGFIAASYAIAAQHLRDARKFWNREDAKAAKSYEVLCVLCGETAL